MHVAEINERLRQRFGATVAVTLFAGRQPGIALDREQLLPVLAFLKTDSDLAFDFLTDLTAVDHLRLVTPALQGVRFAVVYQLYSTRGHHRLRLEARVPEDDLIAPSTAGLWVSALWAEREVYDLFGIEFDDHPELRRLFLPADYPGYPLRKDEPLEGAAGRGAFLEALTARAAAAGAVKTRDIEVGFRHQGLEKLAESVTYDEGVALSGRIHAGRAPASTFGYVTACEELFEIVPPRRAQVLRVILAELTRVREHLSTMRRQALAVGAEPVAVSATEHRASIDRALADIAGDRRQGPLLEIGGLTRDVSSTSIAALATILADFPQFLRRLEERSARNRLFAARLRGTGRVDPHEAVGRGLTGPALRASGVAYDVRRARPYSGYERYDFAVPTGEAGDSWARFTQRLQECRESLRIIAQARDDLPQGPVQRREEDRSGTESPSRYAGERVYSPTEAPTGELGYFVIAGEGPTPYRMRVRAPSLYHAALLSPLLAGENVDDVPGVIASFGLVAGEVDR